MYIAISVNGTYVESPSGKFRYKGGLSVMDRKQRDPYGTYLRVTGQMSFSVDLLGCIYVPIITIDRFLWHKDIIYAIDYELGHDKK